MTAKAANDYRCAVELTVKIAGGKWKPLIVHYLLGGTKRFGELGRLIGGVTQRSLTLQLRELEASGIVTRKVFAQVPPCVEYTLTPLGHSLAPTLEAMKAWGELYLAQMPEDPNPRANRLDD
ncbi:winged helix-turn-helix transcriptional regulator [Pseudomonas thivervalensis]|uniref:winged helix-turn-helix transcriptional regulator n=1 Tax=Pseudomonas thivervalensis TaxID=86265 RepID=UPI00069CDD45|nr:helix-turn-helix domain-containing protein [Pseudomonas thivervalensis]OAB54219.1 HxlR family transcriptional regulator [Pseudomonas thivervalensis]SDG35087.1 DNA-binding transcriptional regulator, HxlR family [Pseudomonas thivervalensis]